MFGFGRKKASSGTPDGFMRVANEAYGGLAGLLENNRLVFRDFEIELSGNSRGQLAERMKRQLAELSRNPDNWSDDLCVIGTQVQKTDNYDVAAFAMVAALVKTDLCCKVALTYSEDERVTEITQRVVTDNLDALDKILLQQGFDQQSIESTPASDAYSEFVHVKRFMDHRFGLRKL
jgi:hypothetical protein